MRTQKESKKERIINLADAVVKNVVMVIFKKLIYHEKMNFAIIFHDFLSKCRERIL